MYANRGDWQTFHFSLHATEVYAIYVAMFTGVFLNHIVPKKVRKSLKRRYCRETS